MMTVRHPLARLYSAYRDKFRKGHPWFVKVIQKEFGEYLEILERKDMTDEEYEHSFEAFVEMVALTQFDRQRDQHWRTMYHLCAPCNIEYRFISRQETVAEDEEDILRYFKVNSPQIQLPPASTSTNYQGSSSGMDVALRYANLSTTVIENIYKIYYMCVS